MMQKILLKFFIYFNVFFQIFAYYERQEVSVPIGKSVNTVVSNGATIQITKQTDGNIFPSEFVCSFVDVNNQQRSYVFHLVDGIANKVPSNIQNVYTKNVYGNYKLTNLEINPKIETYKSHDGSASATLVENVDLANTGIRTTEKFRCLITIFGQDIEYDIVPVVIEYKNIAKSSRVDSSSILSHSVRMRKASDFSTFGDYATVDDVQTNTESNRKKRVVGGSPVELYVEAVMVADYSAYLRHKINSNLTDDNQIFLFMKIYYSHLANSINQRYVYTLKDDPDLKIQVRLTNFVIQRSTAESSWTDINNVGVSGTPTYNGREVIVTSPTLDAFRSFMENTTFPFTYDHAFGIFDKDLWSNSAGTAATRTGTAGFAWVSTVCDTRRYSINEDNGFRSIVILAHELGHNLGSYHDGDATNSQAALCSASDNYIMTAVSGSYSTNLDHYFKFSNCSILQFKTNLLDATGQLKSAFNCLSNVPVNAAIETSYFNSSLAGQLYNADDQCQLIIGVGSKASTCTNTNICETLWCHQLTGSSCTAIIGAGALDGTSCGSNMICRYGFCVSNTVTSVTNFPSNPCSTNPCLNSGVCIQKGRFYMCNCPAGYAGVNCEISGSFTTVPTVTTKPTTITTVGSTIVGGSATAVPTTGGSTTTKTLTTSNRASYTNKKNAFNFLYLVFFVTFIIKNICLQ